MTKKSDYNEHKKDYTIKYQKENYDQIAIRVPKGKRAEYKTIADAAGLPLSVLIMQLLDEEGRRQKEKAAQKEKDLKQD